MNDNEELKRELQELKLQVQRLSSNERRFWSARTRSVVGITTVIGLTVAGVAVSQPVVTTFAPNAPAIASAVNTNFANVVAYTVPVNAIMFFDTVACPTGWIQVAQGRSIVGRPSNGTNAKIFGTAVSGDAEPSHTHTEGVAGNHSHTGYTGAWINWIYSQINYSSQPGHYDVYGIQNSVTTYGAGDHTHGIGGVNAGTVMPYIYYTACKKT